MTKEEVVQLMESSQTAEDWDTNADKVKAACNGYPSFWFPTIVMSGLVNRVAARWGGSGGIRIGTL